ncbi:MAG: VOC family protein [Provencibacterium sp.]|jgi:catechol 2,3-dioxygenase-like lactoylglutathione lyase family enzyme|nr:VOC family protein [Provencibacterium sp.]
MVTRIGHSAIRARDAEKTAAFYVEMLGMQEAFRMDNPDGTPNFIYISVAPGQFIEIFSGGTKEMEEGKDLIGHCHICYEVADIKAAYEELKAKGAPLDTEIKTGRSLCLQFWTHDPDGNKIELMQLPPESWQAQANARLYP